MKTTERIHQLMVYKQTINMQEYRTEVRTRHKLPVEFYILEYNKQATKQRIWFFSKLQKTFSI